MQRNSEPIKMWHIIQGINKNTWWKQPVRTWHMHKGSMITWWDRESHDKQETWNMTMKLQNERHEHQQNPNQRDTMMSGIPDVKLIVLCFDVL